MTMEIGVKFKYAVLAKDNVYLFKVYLLTIISSFWSCPSVCTRSKTQIQQNWGRAQNAWGHIEIYIQQHMISGKL